MAIPTMVFAEDGEVVLVNDAWTGITGYSAAELATIPQWTSKAYGARAKAMNAVIAADGCGAATGGGAWCVTGSDSQTTPSLDGLRVGRVALVPSSCR